MLGKVSKVRHAVVGIAIAGTSALAGLGVVGAGSQAERFDAKLIVVEPRSGDTIRVTEYVDQDFGHHARHGYERLIPNDFGAADRRRRQLPRRAGSSSACATRARTTRIRIGDPDTTIKGQHRYELSYTYPEAMLSEAAACCSTSWPPEGDGWPGDNETGRFEVIGWSASSSPTPASHVGPDRDSRWRLHARPRRSGHRAARVPRCCSSRSPPGEGLTIEGDGSSPSPTSPTPSRFPALPDRRP